MAEATLRGVQVEALVVTRIIKHATSPALPAGIATGALVGMDVDGILQVTNSFPYPLDSASAAAAASAGSQDRQQGGAAHDEQAALAAPRTKANVAYAGEMVRMLREVNVDANNVGWYSSTSLANFVSLAFVETQAAHQREAGERAVALVYDSAKTAQGSLGLRAFRLSPLFMTAYKDNKFTTESLQKSGLRHGDIFTELPVTVHESHLLASMLHGLDGLPAKQPPLPHSVRDLDDYKLPLAPNFAALDLVVDPYLERSADLILESLDAHHTEANNAAYFQRALGREQAKITAWQAKRKAENAARVAAKQTPLPEDEWQRLFRLPAEPSRLEMLLASAQVELLAAGVDGFSGTVSGKLFGARDALVRAE